MPELDCLLDRAIVPVPPTLSVMAALDQGQSQPHAYLWVALEAGVGLLKASEAKLLRRVLRSHEELIAEVVDPAPAVIRWDASVTVADLLQQIQQHRVSALPVVDGQGHPLGVLTTAALLAYQVQQHQSSRQKSVHRPMVPPLAMMPTCRSSTEQPFLRLMTRLNRCLDLPSTLEAVVDDLRQLIQADRVILYQFLPSGSGTIVAEALAPGWRSLLGQEVHDAHFSHHMVEAYRHGRTQITADIFAGGMADCHVAMLQALQVRALVVVPIVHHGRLWGLLSAHDCTAPRQWQPDEVTLMQVLSTQVAIAIQQADLEQQSQAEAAQRQAAAAQLQHQAQQRDLLIRLIQAAVMSSDLEALFADAVAGVQTLLAVDATAILELMPHRNALRLRAGQGWPEAWMGQASVRADHQSQFGYTLQQPEPVIVEDLRLETRFSGTPFLHNQGIISGVSLVIGDRDGVYGVLSVHCRHPRIFNSEEIRWLQAVVHILSAAVMQQSAVAALAQIHAPDAEADAASAIDPEKQETGQSPLAAGGNRYHAFLRAVIDACPIYIYVKNRDGKYILANQAMAKTYGMSPEALIGLDDYDLNPNKEVVQQFLAENRQIIDRGATLFIREEEATWLSTQPQWRQWFKQPLQLPTDDEICVLGIGVDISDRKQAELALQESEAKFRQFAEHINSVFWMTSASGEDVLYVSPAFDDIWGFPGDQLYAAPERWLEAIHPEDRPAVLTAHAHKSETGCFDQVYRIFRPDGQIRWVRDRGFAIRDEQGQIQRLVGIAEDFTAQKQAEIALQTLNQRLEDLVASRTHELMQINQQLRQEVTKQQQAEAALQDNRRFLELVMDSIPQSIFWKDCHQVYLGCNENFARIVGLDSKASILGKRDADLPWTVYASELAAQDDQRVMATGSSQRRLSARPQSHHGQPVWFETNKLPLYDSQNQIIGVLGTCEDISARIHAEDALRESEERFRNLFEFSNDAIFVQDFDGRILDVNSVALDLFGYSRSELLAMTLADLSPPEEASPMTTHLSDLAGCQSTRFEANACRKDGTRLQIELSARVVDPDRQMIQIIVRDISARKRAEAEILRNLAREKELNILKSRFISMASHELRTPLTTILGSAELLQYSSHRWPPEKIQRHFEQIKTTVQHMTALVNDVLLVSKADADRLPVHPTEIDLVGFCQGIIEELRLSDHGQHDIQLVAAVNPCLGLFDEHLLRQIFVNLISNALKYAPSQSPVDIRICPQAAQVEIEVEDYGIGIPTTDLAHLFESFHRASNVGSIPGTGLGLPIVKRAVDLHKGQIHVESEEAKGTLVTVTLPLYPVADFDPSRASDLESSFLSP